MAHSNAGYVPRRTRQIALSQHAAKRAQQRGIHPDAAKLLTQFGTAEFDNEGGIRYLMTATGLSALTRVVGWTKQIEALAGLYAVVSAKDGSVITLGHRYG